MHCDRAFPYSALLLRDRNNLSCHDLLPNLVFEFYIEIHEILAIITMSSHSAEAQWSLCA
jgi:hypothetical protein